MGNGLELVRIWTQICMSLNLCSTMSLSSAFGISASLYLKVDYNSMIELSMFIMKH